VFLDRSWNLLKELWCRRKSSRAKAKIVRAIWSTAIATLLLGTTTTRCAPPHAVRLTYVTSGWLAIGAQRNIPTTFDCMASCSRRTRSRTRSRTEASSCMRRSTSRCSGRQPAIARMVKTPPNGVRRASRSRMNGGVDARRDFGTAIGSGEFPPTSHHTCGNVAQSCLRAVDSLLRFQPAARAICFHVSHCKILLYVFLARGSRLGARGQPA